MSKYRCPVCGATHREMPDACRLCGQLMGEDNIVGDFSGAKHTVVQKKGVGGIMLAAILGVVVLVVVLALLGLGPGSQQIDQAANKLNIKPRANGWTELSDSDGRFSTDFPSNDRKQDKDAVSPLTTNKGTRWSVVLGTDTIVSVGYFKLDASGTTTTAGGTAATGGPSAPGLLRMRALGARLKEDIEATEAKVDKLSDDGFAGLQAQYIEARRVKNEQIPGKELYMKSYIFVRGDVLYTITTESVYAYDKMEAWGNLLQNFTLL